MSGAVFPPHWKVTQLSDDRLLAFENGIWTGAKPPLVECLIIRNTNFTADGILDLSNVAIIPIEQRQLAKKRLIWGDIIIERSGGGPQQPVGRVAFFDVREGDYCFSNFTSRLRVIDRNTVDPYYLHLYLFYFHISGQTERLQRRTTGIRNLAFEDYKNSQVPLPPLPEQRAITHALRAVQAARAARQRELALERERKAALMAHLFTHGTRGEATRQTEIGELPESWRVVRFGDLIEDGPQNGVYKADEAYGEGVRIIRIDGFDNNGVFMSAELRKIRLTPPEVTRYSLRERDILINRVNSLSHLGKCVLISELKEPTVFESNIMRLHVNEQVVLPEYVFRYLLTEDVRISLRSKAKLAVAQASINQGDVRSLLVRLAPLCEQQEIADVLHACDTKIAALQREVAVLDELFRALLEELMTGRLSALPLIAAAVP